MSMFAGQDVVRKESMRLLAYLGGFGNASCLRDAVCGWFLYNVPCIQRNRYFFRGVSDRRAEFENLHSISKKGYSYFFMEHYIYLSIYLITIYY